MRSGPLPLAFLRGCGVPDVLIDYLPSLLNQPIQFYSCFISYSTQDQEFAERLHADLQNKGVRCWFAPHDIQGGKKIHEQIDEPIRLYDRLLLLLSEHTERGDSMGLQTPWSRLTEMTSGWNQGDLVIVAGRPSMGKSVIGLQQAHTTAARGVGVAYISLEMSKESLVRRLVAGISRVDSHRPNRTMVAP